MDMNVSDSSIRLSRRELDAFATHGYLGPKSLLTRNQTALLMHYLRYGQHPAPAVWHKARGVSERFIFDLATYPPLLAWLGQLLTPDIILWGASVVERAPDQSHTWHTDIESSMPDARCVSVWIGLENVSRRSTLRLAAGSHRFGRPIQQAALERGLRRNDLSEDVVLMLARQHDATAEVIEPDMTEGDAILFDGRLWHGSRNAENHTRTALLLQFADAKTPIRIPDFTQLEWPFRFQARPRPPCISLTGSAIRHVNSLVPKPAETTGAGKLGALFRELARPLQPDPTHGWRPYPQFRGTTPVVGEMECHASILSPGCSPHPPHVHLEEELLLVLDGEAELVIPSDPDDQTPRLERLLPGAFVYYPAYQYHTLRNPTASPVTYLMLKWRGAPDEIRPPLSTRVVRPSNASDRPASFSTELLFEGPTAFLGKLHAHVTDLQPDGGYPSHIDAHDVAIVVLSGRVETNDRSLGPASVVYYPAGEPHDMRNATTEPARYLVFEFHAPPPLAGHRRPSARRSVLVVTDRLFLPDRIGGRESSVHDLACLLQKTGHRVAVLARSRSAGPLIMGGGPVPGRLARLSVRSVAERVRFLVHRFQWRAPYPVIRTGDVLSQMNRLLEHGSYDRAIINVHWPHQVLDVMGSQADRYIVYIRDVEELEGMNPDSFPPHVAVVANSEFCAREAAQRIGRPVPVIEPYVERDNYRTVPAGRYVTYVNLVEVKGLDLAYEIALACPDIPFLFLEGWPLSHRLVEKLGQMRARAANITWHRRVLDMRPIYKQTRLLLVPSQWKEAWGRVVVEAQFSGIPAIASDVGGLAQNVSDAGRILDADAPAEAWAEAVRSIWFDDAAYARASERAYRRAESYWKGAASGALRLLELPTGDAHGGSNPLRREVTPAEE